MTWYIIQDNSITLQVWAKPNAKKTNFVTIDERGIHIALQAVPDQGKANIALIAFLSEQLGTKQKEISLKRGGKSRQKLIQLSLDESIVNKLEQIDTYLRK